MHPMRDDESRYVKERSMKKFLFMTMFMFGFAGTSFADFNAYIDFMDVTEDGKVNLYLTGIEGTSETTCPSNIVYLGHNPNDNGSATASHIYAAALTAMTAGKKIRLHTIGCVTKSLRVFRNK